MRTFISIKLPLKILMEIKEIQDSLPEFLGKKTELKNVHLTLKFLGETSSEKVGEIKDRLSNINFFKFEAELKEVGFFDNPKRGIVWISLSNCEKLQKEIDKCLEDLFPKEKRFMAHITIARVKSLKDRKLFLEKIESMKFKKLFFIVDKFYFVESKLKKEGPEYFILKDYALN